MEMFIIYSSLSLVRLIHFKLPHAARHNYCNLLGSFWCFISLGCEQGLLSQSSQEAAGAAFPSPEGATPAQASGHINSFFFPAEEPWNGLGSQSPSHPLSRDTFPIQPWTPAGVWQPQNSCPPEPPPASVSQVGMAPPQPFLRFSRGKKLLQLCPVSKTSPHFFRKTQFLFKAAAAIIPFNCTRGWESIHSYCK